MCSSICMAFGMLTEFPRAHVAFSVQVIFKESTSIWTPLHDFCSSPWRSGSLSRALSRKVEMSSLTENNSGIDDNGLSWSSWPLITFPNWVLAACYHLQLHFLLKWESGTLSSKDCLLEVGNIAQSQKFLLQGRWSMDKSVDYTMEFPLILLVKDTKIWNHKQWAFIPFLLWLFLESTHLLLWTLGAMG